MKKRCVTCMFLWLAMAAPAAAQEAAPPPSEARAVSAERLDRALRRYRTEPSVQRVVRAALEARTASPGRVHDAMDRARGTGWLPTTRVAIRRGQAVDLRGLTGLADTPSNVSTDDDLMVEGSMVFRLDRIVFASEEVPMLRELRNLEQLRAEIVQAVVHLYYERRRLQLERDLLGPEDIAHAVRLLEVEALLDGFTGGAFARMIPP